MFILAHIFSPWPAGSKVGIARGGRRSAPVMADRKQRVRGGSRKGDRFSQVTPAVTASSTQSPATNSSQLQHSYNSTPSEDPNEECMRPLSLKHNRPTRPNDLASTPFLESSVPLSRLGLLWSHWFWTVVKEPGLFYFRDFPWLSLGTS